MENSLALPEKLKDKMTEKVREVFSDLIPADMIRQYVDKELKELMEVELKELVREKIEETVKFKWSELMSEFWDSNSDRILTDRARLLVRECASGVLEKTLESMTMNILSSINQQRGY